MKKRYIEAKSAYVHIKGGDHKPLESGPIPLQTTKIGINDDHPLKKTEFVEDYLNQQDQQIKPINLLLVTHNARLRCFLEDVFGSSMQSLRQKKNVDEIRFKNCCILKITLPKDSSKGVVELVYEGDVMNRKDGAYFSTPHTSETKKRVNGSDIEFLPVEFDLQKLNISKSLIKHPYNIYVVRHGEAEHNLKWSLHLKKDTLLTSNSAKPDDGVRQAVRAGIELKKILGDDTFKAVFVSELKRTWQTLAIVMNQLKIHQEMIVLPCSHELKYSEGGRCDSIKKSHLSFTLAENKSACVDEKSGVKRGDMCAVVDGFKVNWNYFKNFKQSSTQNCTNSNMIQLMLDVVK